VAAFEDEWRLMQQGYDGPETGRARRMARRVLGRVGVSRRRSAPLRIGEEVSP